MSNLWAPKREEALTRVAPLAARVRPTSIDQIVGQTHILGPGKLLRRMIDEKDVPYGVALAIGGLVAFPETAAMQWVLGGVIL